MSFSKNNFVKIMLFLCAFLFFTSCTVSKNAIEKPTISVCGLMVPQTLDELCDDREIIVRATVTEMGDTVEQERFQCFTYYTLQVSDQFKGDSVPQELVIVQDGGETDSYICESACGNRLQIGDEYFFFLNRNVSGDYTFYPGFKIDNNTVDVIEPDGNNNSIVLPASELHSALSSTIMTVSDFSTLLQEKLADCSAQ